jgi:hypothetical protein
MQFTDELRESIARTIDNDPDVWLVEADAPKLVKQRAERRQRGAYEKADRILRLVAAHAP